MLAWYVESRVQKSTMEYGYRAHWPRCRSHAVGTAEAVYLTEGGTAGTRILVQHGLPKWQLAGCCPSARVEGRWSIGSSRNGAKAMCNLSEKVTIHVNGGREKKDSGARHCSLQRTNKGPSSGQYFSPVVKVRARRGENVSWGASWAGLHNRWY